MPRVPWNCPQCGETILPRDRYCFRCGSRLPARRFLLIKQQLSQISLSQWFLGIAGLAVLLAAGNIVHHQSQVMANALQHPGHATNHRLVSPGAAVHPNPKPSRPARTPILHPVVTTRTTYPRPARPSASPQLPRAKPAAAPSPGSWVMEQATYHSVQFHLAVPFGPSPTMTASPTAWTWGETHTPYHVTVSVVPGKPSSAAVTLGAKTCGTPIRHSARVASQQLYINWDRGQWVEVAMTVPRQHSNWLAAIAESVRVS